MAASFVPPSAHHHPWAADRLPAAQHTSIFDASDEAIPADGGFPAYRPPALGHHVHSWPAEVRSSPSLPPSLPLSLHQS